MAGGKRVLMIAPTPYFSDRGCHVQIYEVARSQQAQGNDVRIVTYHLGRDMPGIATERTPRIPWYTKREAGPSVHKFYLDALLMTKTLQVARHYKPDVLHAHLHEGAAIALPAARLLRIPLLLDLQGSLAGELANHGWVRPNGRAYRCLHAVEHHLHQQVDGMLMWTYIHEALQAQFTFDERKVFAVDYGVDVGAFRPHPRSTLDDLYRTLKLPKDRQVVVYLGILSDYQGVDGLLKCIPEVLAHCPNTHFLVMGYPNEELYRAQAHELGIAGHVTLPGRIPYAEAVRYLSLGDIAVAPKVTTAEGNGKLLNYLACGLPTVAWDLPGNRATLSNTGTYVPLGDGVKFAGSIVALLNDPVRRADLAQRSRQRAETRYGWNAIGARIDTVYDTLLQRQVGGPARRPAKAAFISEQPLAQDSQG